MVLKELYFPVIEASPGVFEHIYDKSGKIRQYVSIESLIRNMSYAEYDCILKYTPSFRIVKR